METAVVSQLIDQYGMDVMRFCRSLTRCACDAEDLYQQTFLKLLQLRVKVEREQNPRAFLFSIASGIWKNECRKWGRRTEIAPSSSLEELLDFLEGHMANEAWPPEQVRAYFAAQLPKLNHWKQRQCRCGRLPRTEE